MLRVWGRVNSINVQKVLWALAEVGVPYERIDAGMAFGVNDTPAFKAMNPNGLVPVIDDGGYVLWESNAIVRYLAAKYAPGTLYPDDIGARFHAEQWMDWQATTFNAAITPLFIGLVRTPPEKQDKAAIETARQRTDACIAILDAHLADRAWMGGERFTIADIPAAAGANRWYRLPVERASRPNVERWLAALEQRPGFANHLATPLK